MSDQIPVKAYVFANGMVMVFDDKGQQVPEWNGAVEEKLEQLKKAFPDCAVHPGVWRR